MDRVEKHEEPLQRVAARLRRMGLSVEKAGRPASYDLLVNGLVRVVLRVGFPTMRRHKVRVAGRQYQYRYKTWHFNFHHHGNLSERYTDFFICIAAASDEETERIYVIPWEGVTGKTFSLHGGRQPYSGHYAQFQDAWQVIVREAKAA